MQLSHIPLDQLHVAAVNMRHGKRAPDISDILPSVRARGILQPLLVRPNADGFEIVAGRRRYFSAKAVEIEKGSFDPVPCAIMEAGDDAAAVEASLIENIARLDADEIAQYDTFARLATEGRSVSAIAATFGITERQVKQRLALGNLLPKIKDAYRAERIDPETIQHLTLATKAQQKAWLKLFETDDDNTPFGIDLKHWLFGGASIDTKVAIFDPATYQGHTVSDLFEEQTYFADSDLFWQLQNAAIETKAESLRAAGWSEVIVLETGARFAPWDYEKIPKKKGGKVFVTVSHNGEVEVFEGWLSRKEARKASRNNVEREAEGATPSATSSKPQMTQPMENYVELHRHAVVRLALLRDPATAFRLMVAHLLAPSGNWKVEPDKQRARSPEIERSIVGSAAQAKFDEERKAVREILRVDEDATTLTLFARLLSRFDAEVMRVAAFAMAETLAVGSAVVEAAGVTLQANAAEFWQADDVFFDLLRDRPTINALVADVAGKSVAKGNIDEKVAAQKKIIRDCLAGENWRSKVEGWLPGWLQFPFRAYTKGPCGIADAAKAAAKSLAA